MAATETAYRVLDLEEAALAAGEDNRRRVPLRRDFDIAAFGVNAIYQAKAGEPVIGKHDEISPFAGGHEELYVVGGKPGDAYRPPAYDAQAGFGEAYGDKDYERAVAILRGALEEYPGNEGLTYNLACMEALLGRTTLSHTSRRRWPGSRSRSSPRATTTSPRSAARRSSRSCSRKAGPGLAIAP